MELIATWEQWCPVHAKLDFWREEVLAICDSHEVAVRQIEETFPGTHAVLFVNDDLVLKIFCPFRFNSYDLELRLHRGALAASPLCPRVCFHGTSPSGYNYIAFGRLDGTPVRELRRDSLPAAALGDLAREIGWWQARTIEAGNDGDQMHCLVHYDLTEDHIYLDGEGNLKGIIDWGDAIWAHPSEEFPVLFICCFDCNDMLIETFRRAYDAASAHYRIDEHDLAPCIERHPFRADIVSHLRRRDSTFALRLQRALS